MSERGMKKWAPYASLIEQKGVMAAMLHNRKKVTRPHLSSDQAELIDRRLREYTTGFLTITYFDDGFIHTSRTSSITINRDKHLIVCEDTTISFKDILSIDD